MEKIPAAKEPTFYFIGVTTKQSSIMKVFPKWAKFMGIQAVIAGIDLAIHAPAEEYRAVVSYIKRDPMSLGALVTTHKMDLFAACQDLFEEMDPLARLLHEVSSIYKRDGKLCAAAKDPISSGLALSRFVPGDFFDTPGSELLLMGAGGSSLAMALHYSKYYRAGKPPERITITNRSQPRLEHARQLLDGGNPAIDYRFLLAPVPADNDRILAETGAHSVIVNATGLGKDAPGSPITDQAVFPMDSLVWEINYRGKRDFMLQAQSQREARRLHIEDGWNYFIYGWTQVMEDVFQREIHEDLIGKLSVLAEEIR